jgi:cyclopropane-fatty-acyl-phospholipid synthase
MSNSVEISTPVGWNAPVADSSSHLSWFNGNVRRKFIDWLQSFDDACIEFHDPTTSVRLGNTSADSWKFTVSDNRLYTLLATEGSLGLAEAYLRGYWKTDNLTKLMTVLYRHHQRAGSIGSVASKLVPLIARLLDWRGNTVERSRQQIAAHYDLSNQFFELFLDPTLMYSSAYFQSANATLEQASVAKLEQVCRKLNLQGQENVLEIGTGWGGFALHAAQHNDIRLTSTTISQQQLAKARQRIQSAGLTDRVTLLDSDYRTLRGQYDRIVSIEMIEAVGEKHLGEYFAKCHQLLRPGGRMVIQAIIMPEQRYDQYRRGVDFIQKYIFPGGFLPSLAAIHQAVGRNTDFRLMDIEDLSPHYAKTLSLWLDNFSQRLAEVRQLGFDERFIRMWEYYLCYCEVAFREQAVQVVQIVWDRTLR